MGGGGAEIATEGETDRTGATGGEEETGARELTPKYDIYTE